MENFYVKIIQCRFKGGLGHKKTYWCCSGACSATWTFSLWDSGLRARVGGILCPPALSTQKSQGSEDPSHPPRYPHFLANPAQDASYPFWGLPACPPSGAQRLDLGCLECEGWREQVVKKRPFEGSRHLKDKAHWIMNSDLLLKSI